MILQGLRARLPLRFQLLLAIAAVLAALGSAAIVAASAKAAREYRDALTVDIGVTLDALATEIAGAAVIADYATIEQILKARANRDHIDELAWRDTRGNVLRANKVNTTAARPDWFAEQVALTPRPASQPLQVGGVPYGTVEARFNATPMENRLWENLVFGTAILGGMLAAVFVVVALLLHRGLAPINRLTAAATSIGAGEFGVRVAPAASDPPELRTALAAFNRMAEGVQTLMRELAQAEEALRRSHDALEDKVRARTLDLSAANAALTEEKARQQMLIKKLENAHNQLLQSEKMASIGQLAAGVAHEINNPVSFVSSNLGTLADYAQALLDLLGAYEGYETLLPDEARQALALHKAAAELPYLRDDLPQLLSQSADGLQRVKRIVEDLKDFSRVDEAEWQWANLEQGLESTLRVVWNELKYKAEVVREYAGIPEIECLASQLNQVFANLLVNAAQAMERPGTITLRSGCSEDCVWIEIADTGVGIRPEHLPRIFEPFFTTKPVGKGTGLGLSLSYGIVKKHAGSIDVTSAPARGTTFRITLPIRAHRSGPAEAPGQAAQAA
jgi:signal transduction histidine kinase